MRQAPMIALSIAALLAGPAAIAQDGQQPERAQTEQTQQVDYEWVEPTFTDEGLARIAEMMSGSWRSDAPIEVAASPQTTTVNLHIRPVHVGGIENAMYFEASRADEPQRPFRQMILSLYRYKGEPVLRVYDFRQPIKAGSAVRGVWAVPDKFPAAINADVLFPTIDIPLRETSEGYEGGSDRAQPILRAGAMKLNTEVAFTQGTLEFNDRGFDSEGEVVWGPEQNESQVFFPMDQEPTVERTPDGLVVLHYIDGEETPFETGEWIHMHYAGYLADGSGFDSSRARGEPYRYQAPGRLIAGWRAGVEGMSVGSARRLWVPPVLGYGEAGIPRSGIPGNATLIFDVELMHVER